MNPAAQQILTLIIASLALLCSGLTVYLTVKRDTKNTSTEDISKEVRIAESFKELNVKLDFQSKQLDKMAKSSDESTRQFMELNNKVTKTMEQIAALFKYKDDHENRIRELEDRIK